jgi:hypothetical protein
MELIPELGHHFRGWTYVERGQLNDRGQSYLPPAFHAMTEPERSDALPAYRGYFGEVCEPEHDLDGLAVRMIKIENPYRQAGRVSVRVHVGEAGDAIHAWGQAHISAGHFND